jgi:hypothetical protein
MNLPTLVNQTPPRLLISELVVEEVRVEVEVE